MEKRAKYNPSPTPALERRLLEIEMPAPPRQEPDAPLPIYTDGDGRDAGDAEEHALQVMQGEGGKPAAPAAQPEPARKH